MAHTELEEIAAYLERGGYDAKAKTDHVIVLDPFYSSRSGHGFNEVRINDFAAAVHFVNERE